MSKDAENRNVRNYCQRKKTLRDVLDNHRGRNRGQRVDMRHPLDTAGLRSRDESVTHDVLAYFGGAEVLAKAMNPCNRKRKQHRDAQYARDRS